MTNPSEHLGRLLSDADSHPSELAEMCQREGITARHATRPTLTTDHDGWEHWASDVEVTYKGRSVTIPYRRGTAHERDALEVADVVGSMVVDAWYGEMTYDEMCDELGYAESAPRHAYTTWQACQAMSARVLDLFGADLAEALRHAEP